jgi:hypothetical protein
MCIRHQFNPIAKTGPSLALEFFQPGHSKAKNMDTDWRPSFPSSLSKHATGSRTAQESRNGNGSDSGNSQRFGRPDPHWLRKRAISGAMIHAPTEPIPHPEDNHDTDRFRNELETDDYWSSHGEDQRQPSLATSSPNPRKRDYNLNLPPALERWQSEDIPFGFDYIQGLREQAIQHPNHSNQPRTEGLNPRNSSPPAMIGDPDHWLLPHPFKH